MMSSEDSEGWLAAQLNILKRLNGEMARPLLDLLDCSWSPCH